MDTTAAYEPLRFDQHSKCVWCEQRPRRKATIEHVRPALAATGEGQPSVAPTGYWWLAMSWENLAFACFSCNNFKGTRFPLAEGSPRLRPEEAPPGEEQALLIDPTVEDPAAHLQFVPSERPGTSGILRFRAAAREGSERGRITVELLHLDDDPDLCDELDRHERDVILPHVAAVRAAMDSGRGLDEAWRRALELLEPERELALASHDMLAYYLDEAIAGGRLQLARPWNNPPALLRTPTEQEHAVHALPPDVRAALARLHPASPRDEKAAVIERICRHQPARREVLSLLLPPGQHDLDGLLRQLARAGRLVEGPEGWAAPQGVDLQVNTPLT